MIKIVIYLIVLLVSCLTLKTGSNPFTIRLLTGKELQTILPFVAEQRLTVFREYPYLYEGTSDEELKYLGWFSLLPSSAIVVAYVKDKPVGFITGTAFTDYDEHFEGSVKLFESAGLNPYSYYYISEIIIVPEHRGKGLSVKLFNVIEGYAKSLNYTATCFVTESHDTHPLKPRNYRSLTPLWQKLGYIKSSLFITFSWPTLQLDQTSINRDHKLDYWVKERKKYTSEL